MAGTRGNIETLIAKIVRENPEVTAEQVKAQYDLIRAALGKRAKVPNFIDIIAARQLQDLYERRPASSGADVAAVNSGQPSYETH